ncbi:T9SS type A sorting domain-containing protein [Sediminicola sp. 1XM1-17]|uniref:T9SS type A sorting domain-containing protein n=1 Tax=Sediminicola sp. 1XM1-17 TaxID=3127702 RepID=UPI0030785BEA
MLKVYTLLLIISFFLTDVNAQNSIVSSGGNDVGQGGSSSFSFGQVFYNTDAGAVHTVSQGVQQVYEIFILSEPETIPVSFSILTYPNPTSNNIVLDVKNITDKNLNYSLYDITGRFILTNNIKQEKTTLIMNSLPSGIYFLKVSENYTDLSTFKIIKK